MKTNVRVLVVLFMVFGSVSTFGNTWEPLPGIDHWPNSIRYVEAPDGQKAFVISGLYSCKPEKWIGERSYNFVMRKFKFWAETDSLFITPDNREAWFFTESTPEELLGKFKNLSIYSGCIPTFEELSARDYVEDHFVSDFFVKLGQFEVKGVGHMIKVRPMDEDNTILFEFVQGHYTAFQKNAVVQYGVSSNSAGEFSLSVAEGDSIPYSLLSAYSSFRMPDFAEGQYSKEIYGLAKLNETHEHCKGHMEHALRIYNDAGKYFWLHESGLHGALGLWAQDLTGDGIDELLVLVEDHGKRRIVVFGKSG